jgi:hypothetical protein
MEKQIVGALLAVLMGLAAWNMKTVNDLQLEVKGMMVGRVQQAEIQELKLAVKRLQWLLEDDAMKK